MAPFAMHLREKLGQVIFFFFQKKKSHIEWLFLTVIKNECQIRLVLVAAACKLEFTTMVSSQLVLHYMKSDRQFSILSKNVQG